MKIRRHLPAHLVVAAVLAAGLSAAAQALAEPAESESSQPAAEPSDLDEVMRDIKQTRAHMLDQVNTLKALEKEAEENNEQVRLACIRQKQEDAAKLLGEVVVPEIQRVLEPGVSLEDRRVSRDNLAEASARLDGIVELAKACSESKGPTGEGKTVNSSDLERFIPWLDPTVTPLDPPVPPGVDPTRPPVTQSPMM